MNNLTLHQKQRFDGVLDSLEKNGRAYLSGAAGVGKTFTTNEVLKHFEDPIITATTNEAVKVMQSNNMPSAKTLDSALGNRMFYNEQTFSDHMHYSNVFDQIKPGTLIVVDEASMTNQKQSDQLESLFHNGIKLLFVGDANQLKPVARFGESKIPTFIQETPTFRLTEQMRQTEGSKLHTMLTDIAYGIENKFKEILHPKLLARYASEDVIITDNRKEFLSMFENDGMILTYRNKKVDAYNKVFKEEDAFKAGDIVKLTRPIYAGNTIIHQNREYVELLTCEKRLIGGKAKLEFYRVTTSMGEFHLTPSSVAWKRMVQLLKARKLYADGKNFHQSYATATLGFAGTVHKSQGHSMNTAYYDLTDSYNSYKQNFSDSYNGGVETHPISADDYNRMMYVALSRAKKKVVILASKDNSNKLKNSVYGVYKKKSKFIGKEKLI